MSENYRRSAVVAPKTNSQFNQFLPSKDKQTGYVPAPLRKKRTDSTGSEENRRSWASPMFTEDDGSFSRIDTDPSPNELGTQSSSQAALLSGYESSDSEAERPDPDLQHDDLASRRFPTRCVITPTNFAIPRTSVECTTMPQTTRSKVMVTNVPQPTFTYPSSDYKLSQKAPRRSASADAYLWDDSEEEDDDIGYADPVHDDLYARKVGLTVQQPISTVHYDKFLPKFWTPEEDIHVQRIRLGSQRRPWYRKIQGFSQKKSGSASEDSDDCDVSPQLCVSSPPHSDPSSPHAQTSAQLSPITPSPTTQLLLITQEIPGAQRLQPPDFWPRPDPTSGPRIFRCKRHQLLGREHPNDPFNVSEDILPDLENDDMFSRRTCAFYSNTELAKVKYGGLLSLHHRSEPSIRVVTQHNNATSTYPDIEKDDVVTRRLQQRSVQPSLSGAPDTYHPVPLPMLGALPQKLQAKIFPPCPPVQVDAQVSVKQKEDKHRKTDDMLVRKLGNMQNLTEVSTGTQTSPHVPTSCSEKDLQKWQTIREASQLRYKKRLMVQRMLEKNTETDGSKSIGDIPLEQIDAKPRYEDLQMFREVVKENEDKWQDDLTKWKNRRKSVNSDIMKKKEERENIEIVTTGSSTRKSKTFREMEVERESREPGFRSRFSTFSASDDQDVFDEPTPKTRVLPGRSNTVDNPYSRSQPKVRSLPSLLDDEPEAGSLPTDEVDTPSSPVQSSLGSSHNLLDDPIPINVSSKPTLLEPTSPIQSTRTSTIISSSPLETNSSSKLITKSSTSVSPVPTPRQDTTPLFKPVSTETEQSLAPRVSASLPRSYQRSETARITSVVTPRPFGAANTKVASLPRAYTVDDSQKRFNGETNSSRHTTVNYQTSSLQNSNTDERKKEEQLVSPIQTSSTITPVSRVAPQPKTVSPLNSTQQENFREMRISLSQKPNSSHDFGFQTNWDSTGATVKSIKQGSPAELCHLQVGDKVLAVNGQKVADMSYEQWKGCMDEALQEGSLFMDIRRQGQNSSPEPYANVSLDFTSRPAMDPAVKTVNVSSQPVNTLRSNGINGGISGESVALRNKGGSENQVADILVPSLSASSNRWSWDPEEERRRQEKWQKEQERQLKEKYQQDQEKLKEEFRKAQQEAVTEGTKQYQEVTREKQENREEERRRMEEQKRLEEERIKREEQKRLEDEEKRRREEEALRLQRKREEEEEKRRQEAQHRLQATAMSKSTPELDEKETTDIKAVSSGVGESFLNKTSQNRKEPVSPAEAERQQILQDMKKKTSLLPDNKWIRQNTVNSVNKQPAFVPMRRGESLDNLDNTNNRQSWRSSWTPETTSSIPDYSRPYSSLSANRSSLSQSTSTIPKNLENQTSSRNRSVSGKKMCTYCDMPLGKGAAMIIESLGLCFHLHCFKCFQCKTDLGGSESGAEVRIRNKQLFCNSCYMRFKTGQPTAM